MRFTNVIFISFLLFFAFFLSCADEKQPDHSAALPHNRTGQRDTLTAEEREILAGASGKSSQQIGAPLLKKRVQTDTSSILVINFWQLDCKACIAIQKSLETIELNEGRGKLEVIAVNFDPRDSVGQVDLALRTSGITAPVYQIAGNGEPPQKILVPHWNGRYPALAFFSEGKLQGFYQREFSKNELVAILQPYFIGN